jgi:SAM-dependent methyltransferase
MNGNDSDQFQFSTRVNCPICHARSTKLGEKQGRYIHHAFGFRECVDCTFIFVEDPCINFDRIYDEAYYNAKGADPLTDYMFELRNPGLSIRAQELSGISEAVFSIVGSLKGKSWLDFGCGNGTLVRYLNSVVPDAKSIVGFEEGWIADEARRNQINVLTSSQIEMLNGSYDVVTAIEVLEHVLDPVETLVRIGKLLKPGGLFFYTTGNSAPFRKKLFEWSYVRPEIHIGYFNPRSISVALENAGFSIRPAGWLPGFEKIIRFKMLKTLGFKGSSSVFNLMPWSIVAKVVDMKYRMSDMPMAIAGVRPK